MPIDWGSVTAYAEAHSEKESWSIFKPPEADVRLRCAWTDRHTLVDELLSTGMQWPYFTDVPLYAVSASISTVPGSEALRDGEGNTYETALVDVHFDPYNAFTEKISPNGEMIKISPKIGDDNVFFWADDDFDPDDPDAGDLLHDPADAVTPEEAPTKLIIGLDYVVTFDRLDLLPTEMLTLIDHVNDDTVTGLNLELEFEPETLLLTASNATHNVDVAGGVTNSLELHFSWRQNGWNRFWRAKTHSWQRIFVKYTNPFDPDDVIIEQYNNFPLDDFSPLLPS